MEFDVVVVGSINYDISVFTKRHPEPGETLVGTGHLFGAGGKGANQAVAAARLGAKVALVGRVGDDEWGSSLVENLKSEGVDTRGVGVDSDAATGIAVITIDAEGENTIVGSPGANAELSPDHISENASVIAGASVVLSQLEVPQATVAAAAGLASGTFILNPAPAQDLPESLLERVDILVPNRTELATLSSKGAVDGFDQVASAVRALDSPGATVVTLGSRGALIVGDGDVRHIPALPVNAIDTTGAGDAFCGALAVSLSRAMRLDAAVRFASAAGALATTRRGAQAGLPSRDDVEALLAV
jgi:ribokinase